MTVLSIVDKLVSVVVVDDVNVVLSVEVNVVVRLLVEENVTGGGIRMYVLVTVELQL